MALSHASFYAMNTHMDFLLCDVLKTPALNCSHKIFEETLRIEKLLSRFDSKSYIFNLNKNLSNNFIEISEELASIFETCKQFNQLTLEFFDISIQSDAQNRSYQLEYKNSIASIKKGELIFDFGAFAKGYALDQIQKILKEAKIKNAVVNFGNSSILALGHHPHGDCWKIDLQHSYHPGISVYSFELKDEILTTSGILPNRQLHIKSPQTNQFCNENSSYSVVTSSGVLGEIATTALYAAQDLQSQKMILKNLKTENAVKVLYNDTDFKYELIGNF